MCRRPSRPRTPVGDASERPLRGLRRLRPAARPRPHGTWRSGLTICRVVARSGASQTYPTNGTLTEIEVPAGSTVDNAFYDVWVTLTFQ